jgi:hypothetical protein
VSKIHHWKKYGIALKSCRSLIQTGVDFSSRLARPALLSLKPPSSLSSPFCGHKIWWMMTALIIVPITKDQSKINMQAIAQPMTCIACDSNALPIAKVAVTRAVCGKTKENQVMANGSGSRTQDQCAPTETKNHHRARLEAVSLLESVWIGEVLTPTTTKPSNWQQL